MTTSLNEKALSRCKTFLITQIHYKYFLNQKSILIHYGIEYYNSIIHYNLRSLSIIQPQECNYRATINMKPTQHYLQLCI